MKNYTAWLKTATLFQFIFAFVHGVSLFVTPSPNNDTEKQLFDLLDTYRFDFGAGFHRTMSEIIFTFSACLCLVCLFGGLINGYLLRKNAGPEIMKGVITINLIVFGILLGLMVAFTFLPSIILTGLIVLFLVLARFTMHKGS